MSDKGTIEQLHAELAQAREELVQAQTEIARVDKISDGYATGWADACAARDALARECNHLEEDREYNAALVTGKDRELAQARAELKDLQATDRQFGRQAIRRNRDYWYDKAVAAECERDEWRKKAQEQSDEVQEHWLSPVEAEGLRRQLTLMDAERETWLKEADALEMKLDNAATGEAAIVEAAKALIKRLLPMTFVENEPVFYCAFSQLKAALEHRSEAAGKLLERLVTLDAAEAALATERQLRREAERRARELESSRDAWRDGRDSVTAELLKVRDWLEKAEQRAERAERAEARAQLVTEELAELLVRLGHIAGTWGYHDAAEEAHTLAARIKEALGVNDA